MAYSEELRLTVSVDDQASAQLQGLRGQLTSMGGGAQAAGMERVRRQSVEVGRGFAGLSQELSQFATRAGVIGGVVGAISSKVIELGSNFLNRVTDVKGYSDAIVTLNKNATLAGTSSAQFQASMDKLREASGGTAEEAAAGLLKFGESWVDLQRQSSQFRRSMVQGLSGQDLQNMQNLLTNMARNDVNTALNLYLDYADRIEKRFADMGDPTRGAQVRREFLQRGGVPYVPTGTRIEPVSQERQDLLAARTPGAKEFAEAQEQTSSAWARMATSAAAIMNRAIPFGTHMKGVKDDVTAGADALERWEGALRKAGGLMPWLKANAPGWLKGEAAPDTRPTAAPGEKPTERDLEERRRKFLADEERRRRELLNIPPGATEPPPSGPRPRGGPSAPVARPPGYSPSRFPLRPPAPATAVPAPETPPAAPETAPEAPAAVMDEAARNAAAAEAARQATAETAEAARQAAAVERRRQAARGWVGTAPPPAPPPAATAPQQLLGGQQPPAPAGAQPQPVEGRAFDVPAIGDLLKAIQDGGITAPPANFAGTGWRGLPLSRNVVDERGQLPAAPPAITVTPPPVSVVAPSPPQPQPIVVPFGDRFGEWPQPQPQPATVEPSRGRELVPLDTGQAPPPSAFEGGRIGLMGGTSMDLSQAGQALDARALDRAAARDVNVNGSGKISVDVRAPAGTRVGAQGQGLFKTTEITRQTQMMPAEYGPMPATGIGAAEG